MLEVFIKECKEILRKNQELSPIEKFFIQSQKKLHVSDFSQSFINHLQLQNKEPMQIAIIGQFSSGKSTFLNALLGQDILPTGITPITSKVCKICYGEDYILEILYKDGRKVLQSVDFFKKLSREKSQNIESFCLYAPIILLKNINFLDTPGFNSQNSEDTFVANQILERVDGIIWLTLIDNAGKNSEKKLLKEMMQRYSQKSLCVLNQKDRLKNDEEIALSVDYAKEAFDGIFAKVIAISARNALKARLNTKEKIIFSKIESLNKEIEKLKKEENLEALFVKNSINALIKDSLEKMQEEINALDISKSDALLRDSNINLILDFLEKEIKPKARILKEYSIKKRLKEQHILLHLQMHKTLFCYKKLIKILENNAAKMQESLLGLQEKNQKIFNNLYVDLDLLLDSMAQKIYKNLEEKEINFSLQQKGFLRTKTLQKNAKIVVLPLERLKIEMQNSDTQIIKNLKALSVQIGKFCKTFQNEIESFSANLTKEILHWKNVETKKIESYVYSRENEFLGELREFSTKLYENILLDFYTNDLLVTSYLQSELNFLSQFISTNYNNAIDLSLNKLDSKMQYALKKYKENPLEFALFVPTLENIRDFLNEAFCFEQFQTRLFGPMNLLKKSYMQFSCEFSNKITEKTDYISNHTTQVKSYIQSLEQSLKEIKNF